VLHAAQSRIKVLMDPNLTDTDDDHYTRLVAESTCAFGAGEAAEGLRARLEKRAPAWTLQS
jgi:enoyl-CoA hydratase/carnithine racemase